MLTEGTLTYSFKAAGDLSGNQYEAMIMSAPKTVTVATGTTNTVVGILQNAPDAAGEAAHVALIGVCKAKVGATTTDGAYLGPAADGALDPVTADGAEYCAIALDDGADGDIIEVLLVGAQTISAP